MKRTVFDLLLSYLLSAGLACAVLVIGLTLIYLRPPGSSVAEEEEVWPAPFRLDPTELVAQAAVVYDPVGEQILYEKNMSAVLPLASLTKLIAAEAVLKHQPAETEVSISAAALAPEGDWGFWVGEAWPVGDLVYFALAASSNDAIAAAAESLGADYIATINLEAKKLDLDTIRVLNPTGLDESLHTAGGYGSAHDVALLAAAFMQEHPTFFEVTAAPYATISHGSRVLTATSTAGPLLDIPGLIGAKTGYTDLAGGNLVAAFDLELGRPLIIAVLGSTREGRFADVKTLLEAARRK